MWGAPSTGKTTFLASLSVALEDQEDHGWRLRGKDSSSTLELGSMRTSLMHRGEFPAASMNSADYNWELVDPDPSAGRRGLFGRRRPDKTVRIPLRVRDAPGRYANPEEWETPGAKDMLEKLAASGGIIFLYDPIREFEFGDAYQHTSDLLAQLDMRVGGEPGGLLPHYLAVCLTKFDEVKVLESAERAGLVEYDPERYECPYVDEDDAEEFFARLCRVSPNPAAQALPRTLHRHFHPDRIRFYITSAIGFYVDSRTNRYDPDNPQNVIKDGAKPKIRGAIHPVNVVEPVLWLSETLRKVR